MASKPSQQWYPGDYLRAVDLRKCSFEVQGIWRAMLDLMWCESEQGKIKGSPDEICRLVGCSDAQLSSFLAANLRHKFADVTKRNGNVTIVNRRMYRAYIEREATKTRVQRYRSKQKRDCNDEVTPYSSSSTSINNNKGRNIDVTYSPDFLEFWKAYPRKVGKDKAWESWQKKKPPLVEVLSAIDRQKKEWSDPKYIPHPTTWLNQGRWKDEGYAPPPKEKPKCKFCGAEATNKRDGIGWMCSSPDCKAKMYA